jgi:thiol-disulfide isomerase/thioredoxin
MLPIITKIDDRNHFVELLQKNPGAIVIKFGAIWCGPCKLIENKVNTLMNMMPDRVQCVIVDVDECVDLYSFLKTKKMVNGIPVILVYYKGNLNYIPDDRVVGADTNQIVKLFNNVVDKANGKTK